MVGSVLGLLGSLGSLGVILGLEGKELITVGANEQLGKERKKEANLKLTRSALSAPRAQAIPL